MSTGGIGDESSRGKKMKSECVGVGRYSMARDGLPYRLTTASLIRFELIVDVNSSSDPSSTSSSAFFSGASQSQLRI